MTSGAAIRFGETQPYCPGGQPSKLKDTRAHRRANRIDSVVSLEELLMRKEANPRPQRGEVLVRLRAGISLARA